MYLSLDGIPLTRNDIFLTWFELEGGAWLSYNIRHELHSSFESSVSWTRNCQSLIASADSAFWPSWTTRRFNHSKNVSWRALTFGWESQCIVSVMNADTRCSSESETSAYLLLAVGLRFLQLRRCYLNSYHMAGLEIYISLYENSA